MKDRTINISTTIAPEDVMVRAVQFFTTERWRAQSQTNRIATFVGVPKIPMLKVLIMLILLFCFVIPGLIYYLVVLRSLRRLQNIVVTTTPSAGACSVVVTYPKHAQKLVDNFVASLPTVAPLAAASR
jgi:hypothetical protein